MGRGLIDTNDIYSLVPMIKKTIIRKDEYRDSIVLMQISEKIQQMEGVEKAAVVMATENNKKLLEYMNLMTEDIKGAGPNDFVGSASVPGMRKSWTQQYQKSTNC